VVDRLTVEVTTTVPWVAFPAALYNSGRVLMVAQAQLDADTESCEREPIGTGPFQLSSWEYGTSMKLQRNERYWQDAPDGEPYPYLNAVDFRPIGNDDARIAALHQGDINMMHSSSSADIARNLAQLRDDGAINLLVSQDRTETVYLMMNVESEPFGRREARIAAAQAIDRARINEETNRGLPSLADGPFAPGVMGHLDDNGFPDFDMVAAKAAVAELEAAGADLTFRLLSSSNPSTLRTSSLAMGMLEEAGFTVELEVELQVDLISRIIAGDYDMAFFRNQPGDDPDTNRVWWYGEGNPVNFGNFDDPVINENLDTGRQNPDEDVRREAYEAINRQMGSEVWNIYLFFQPWAVAMAPNVHGVIGPPLPNGDDPANRLSLGHSLLGVWIEQ
jgi:peptide/nickel transport system substrate-binding protein